MVLFRCAVLSLLASVLFLVSAAEAKVLQRVRYGHRGALSRVTFDLAQKMPYHLEPTSDPTTLRVVFPALTLPPNLTLVQASDPLLREIRLRTTGAAVLAEIVLKEPGLVQRQMTLTSPPRVVLDIARRTDNAAAPVVSSSRTPAVRESASREAKDPGSLAAQPVPSHAPAPLPARETPPPSTVPAVPLAALSATQLLERAETLWAARQVEAARRAYTTFVQRYPDYPKNHLIAARIAEILHDQGQPRAALEAYTAVIQGYPGSEGSLISQIRLAELGTAKPDLLPAGDETRYTAYRHPMATMQRLVAEYPFSPLAEVARFKIGEIVLQQREFARALEIFETLLGRPLQDTLRQDVANRFREALLRLLTAQHQRGASLEVLRTFFAHKHHLRPTEALHSDFLVPVALSYAQLGLLDEAQSLFTSVLPSLADPAQQARLVFEQALRFANTGHLRAAASLLTPPERFTEPAQRAQILSLLTQDAWQAGHLDDTVRYGHEAVTLLTEPAARTTLWGLLAAAHEARGETRKALHALQQCATEAHVVPQTAVGQQVEACLVQAAALQAQAGQPKQALATYEQLLQSFPASLRKEASFFHIADIHRQQGDTAQMLATFGRLRDNTNDTFWQKVATEYLEQAQWQERLQERLMAFQNSLLR